MLVNFYKTKKNWKKIQNIFSMKNIITRIDGLYKMIVKELVKLKRKLKKLKKVEMKFKLENNIISVAIFGNNDLIFWQQNLFNWQQSQYFHLIVFFFIIFIISCFLYLVAKIFSITLIKDMEKLSQYECGFMPLDEATRHPFDVHFYVVGILFLIFDVEIALLFPWIIGLKESTFLHFLTMFLFLGILTIGFFYEWHRGALIWTNQKNV